MLPSADEELDAMEIKMAEQKISFEDGGLYERTMGVWTRLAGDTFLDWLNPAPSLDWIDVGCGNGAFTDLIDTRCAPLGNSKSVMSSTMTAMNNSTTA